MHANTFRSDDDILGEKRREMVAELTKLQAEVQGELAERQAFQAELEALEAVNAQLRAKLYSTIKVRKTALGGAIGDEDTPAIEKLIDPETACYAAGSFLSSANSALRSGVMAALDDRRELKLDTYGLSKSERAEVDWVMSTDGSFKHHNHSRNPFRDDVAHMASDWKKVLLKSGSASSTLVEDVTDAIGANKSLHGEYSAKQEYESSDEVVADAIDNWGFSREEPTYEFDDEDSESNIVMDATAAVGMGRIKCATLNKLVERVTHEKHVDLNTRYVFLLTYNSFTTPSELLNKLASRYDVPIPPNMTHEEIQMFKTTKLDRIQIRVCSVLKNWLDEHYNDFENSPSLKGQLQDMLTNMIEKSASALSTQLAKNLFALIKRKDKFGSKKQMVSSPKFPKTLISSKVTLSTFSMTEANETEIARQLTLMDMEKFRGIQPRECLNQAWTKKDKETRAPNILAMIEQFNKVTSWVQLSILEEKDVNKRAAWYKKFIVLAQKCRELNNFNSLFAIYTGLSANPIHRLRRTKELVGAKHVKIFDDFKELFKNDKNSRNFRKILATTLTPCIPHLGIFLGDLTFTEEGNLDMLQGMINFQKRAKLAERIRWIKQYQQESYQFQPLPAVQDYFKQKLKVVDPETMWKMSLTTEPREVEA